MRQSKMSTHPPCRSIETHRPESGDVEKASEAVKMSTRFSIACGPIPGCQEEANNQSCGQRRTQTLDLMSSAGQLTDGAHQISRPPERSNNTLTYPERRYFRAASFGECCLLRLFLQLSIAPSQVSSRCSLSTEAPARNHFPLPTRPAGRTSAPVWAPSPSRMRTVFARPVSRSTTSG